MRRRSSSFRTGTLAATEWFGGGVYKIAKAGGATSTVVVPPAGALGIVVDATNVYWAGPGRGFALYDGDAGYDNRILSVAIADAGTPVIITSTDDPWLVVANSSAVYTVGDGTALEITETPLDGGPTKTVARPLANAVEDIVLASDGTLYWTTDTQVQAMRP